MIFLDNYAFLDQSIAIASLLEIMEVAAVSG